MPSLSPIMAVANLPPSTESLDAQQPCFTLFPKLAPELGLKIWRLALPGPRIVRLSYILHPSNKTCTFTATPEDYVIVARATIPALLHTCLKARDVALADYQQAFARRLLNPVYFDFEQDIIVGCPNTIVAFSVKDSELTDATLTGEEPIRRLMISEYPSGLFGRIFPTNRLNMLPFKALERIIIQQNTSSGQLLPLLVNRMSINWQRDFEDKPNYVCNFLHSEEMETKAMEMFSAPVVTCTEPSQK